MKSCLEPYEAKEEGVTLHIWTDVQGAKQANFYITGMPGTPIPGWFRKVMHQKHNADMSDFPHIPARFNALSSAYEAFRQSARDLHR